MSTLQVANIWFESTANNRIQYLGSNTIAFVVGGSNTLVINTTATAMTNVNVSAGNSTANYSLISTGLSVVNSTSNTTISSGSISIGNSSLSTNGSVFTVNTQIKSPNLAINAITANTYTLVNSDSGGTITCTNSTITTITVPVLPVGFRTYVVRLGSAAVSFTGSGVTLASRTGAYSITTQYGSASVFAVNSSYVVIDGNI